MTILLGNGGDGKIGATWISFHSVIMNRGEAGVRDLSRADSFSAVEGS